MRVSTSFHNGRIVIWELSRKTRHLPSLTALTSAFAWMSGGRGVSKQHLLMYLCILCSISHGYLIDKIWKWNNYCASDETQAREGEGEGGDEKKSKKSIEIWVEKY